MKKRFALALLGGFAVAGILALGSVRAQQAYTYQCPRCGLTVQYTMPGFYRCPNDGTALVAK